MTKQDEKEEYEVRDESPHDYFTQIPNLVGEMLTTPQSFRLYAHLKRVAGVAGKCWQSTRTLARACKMSAGAVSAAKQELISTTPPLIKIGWEKGEGGSHHVITITDIWMLNHQFFLGESVHILNAFGESVQNMNAERSEYETKNIPSKNIPSSKKNTGRKAPEGNSQKEFTYEWPPEVRALADAFENIWEPAKKPMSGGEYAFWLHGNKRSGAHGFTDYAKVGITEDDIRLAAVRSIRNKLTIANPNSLYTLAYDAMTQRVKHNGNGKSLQDTQAERRDEFENSKPLEE